MKEFLKKIGRVVLKFLIATQYIWFAVIGSIVVGFVVGVITISILTFFGIVTAFVAYFWLRQIWWWITKTGDYKRPDDEENSNTKG